MQTYHKVLSLHLLHCFITLRVIILITTVYELAATKWPSIMVSSSRLNSRAVHLDVAADCTTMEYMQVLRTVFALRGVPELIISEKVPS